MNFFLLCTTALFPVSIMLTYILRGEFLESRRTKLLLKIFLTSTAMVPLAIFFGLPLLAFVPAFNVKTMLGTVLVSFVCIGVIEEGCKLIPVLIFAWRKEEFKNENDGIVYAAMSALGFAALENFLFVMKFGFATGVARAFISVPVHCAFGVIMGYYLGRAHKSLDARAKKINLAKAYFLPTLLHGLFDALVLTKSWTMIFALPMTIFLVILMVKYRRAGRALAKRAVAQFEEITGLHRLSEMTS